MTQLRDTPAPQADSGGEAFRVGDRVRINKRTADGCNGVYKRPGNNGTVTAVVAVTTVLFDCGISATYDRDDRKLEPLPPSEDPKRQPEANPLRPETIRKALDAWSHCKECRAKCETDPRNGLCSYCSLRSSPIKHGIECFVATLDARIASATPKEAEREVWDWDCWSTSGAES